MRSDAGMSYLKFEVKEVTMDACQSKTMSLHFCVLTMLTLSYGVGSSPATAGTIPFFFSTGNPDGLIATLSRVASPGKLETETADDFVTTQGQNTCCL